MIKVSLNNETRELPAQTHLGDAIEQWRFDGQNIAIAVNGTFIPRTDYTHTLLNQGDQIDIVKPVGGG
ncbi:MAG: sulfur carrier protein ThiS [Exilibacterium sp.]